MVPYWRLTVYSQATEEMMDRQDLWLTDNNGDVIRLKAGYPAMDHRKPEAREMWAEGG